MAEKNLSFHPIYIAFAATEKDCDTIATLYGDKRNPLLVVVPDKPRVKETIQSIVSQKKTIYWIATHDLRASYAAYPLALKTALFMGYTHALNLQATKDIEKKAKTISRALIVDAVDTIYSYPLTLAASLLNHNVVTRDAGFETEMRLLWEKNKWPTERVEAPFLREFSTAEKMARFLAKIRIHCRTWQLTRPPWA